MTENSLLDYLEHMRQAATEALSFVAGLTYESFMADTRTKKAVLMSLFVVGEAAAKMMLHHQNFVSAHPDLPWSKMRGLRNRLAHGYFDINYELVWNTTQTDLPELLAKLAVIQP